MWQELLCLFGCSAGRLMLVEGLSTDVARGGFESLIIGHLPLVIFRRWVIWDDRFFEMRKCRTTCGPTKGSVLAMTNEKCPMTNDKSHMIMTDLFLS